MDEFEVYLIRIGGERHTVTCCRASMTVGELRAKAAEALDEVPCRIRLLQGTKALNTNMSLENCGVTAREELSVVLTAPALILDGGSDSMKAGIAGEDEPRIIFPSLTAVPKGSAVMDTDQFKAECSVGKDAWIKRGIARLRYPVEHGIIVDWEHMERVWHHTFYNELRVNPEAHPVLLTEKPMNPKANRERMTLMMFEEFCVPQLYIASSPVLCLHSVGKTTGIIIESGRSVSYAVPIYEGCALNHAIDRLDMGGRDVTEYMIKLLAEKGHRFETSEATQVVQEMKEKMVHVGLDIDTVMKEQESGPDQTYKLPDGETIHIPNSLLVKCAEPLFQPALLGFSTSGIVDMTYHSIMCCDPDVRLDLYRNIVLSGGSTMFPGFPDRMQRELSAMAPTGITINVAVTPNGRLAAWVGGSQMAALDAFSGMWMTSSEFDEIGPSLVHEKCVF